MVGLCCKQLTRHAAHLLRYPTTHVPVLWFTVVGLWFSCHAAHLLRYPPIGGSAGRLGELSEGTRIEAELLPCSAAPNTCCGSPAPLLASAALLLAVLKADEEFMTAALCSDDADVEADGAAGLAMGILSVGNAGSLGRGRFAGEGDEPSVSAPDAPACC